jgi:Fe-Mn family superoxide dismutase
MNEKDIKKVIRNTLGLDKNRLDESYVTKAQKYDLNTSMLSEKSKKAHQDLLAQYVDDLNTVSAKLDAADRDEASLNHSEFRSLKADEVYNLNASFLHAWFFENISDPNSVITMDSLAFMRIERDFGSFDAWQKDFVACAMSARNGWACTVYNTFLQRYINVVVDLHSNNVPFASYPVIVLDCWEHSYFRDYLKDRKTYVYAMMKEFNWKKIESRVKIAEKIGKVTASGASDE